MLGYINRQYSRNGIHGRVVHDVGTEIVAGLYKPGERLPSEQEFIDRFQGSRTAIREAFRVLTAKGLLEAKQRAGTSVRHRKYWNLWDPDVLSWHKPGDLSAEQAKQLMRVRSVLEPEAARLLSDPENDCGYATTLEKACVMMDRAWDEGNVLKVRDAEMAFHCFLVGGCGNEFISRGADVVRLSVRYCQEQQDIRSEKRLGASRWYGIVAEKILARDPVGAANGVASLINRDQQFLFNDNGGGGSKRRTTAA